MSASHRCVECERRLTPTEQTFGSTTFDVEIVTIRRPRRAKGSAPQASSSTLRGWRGLKRLDWRRATWMALRYRHGSEPYVVVEARGREWAYPAFTAVIDVLRDVANR